MIRAHQLLIICIAVSGNLQKCNSNKCSENADCYLTANNKDELKPVCTCKPGYYGDGSVCETKFTLVIELCRNKDGSLIHNALRPHNSNTSMHLNFWLFDDEKNLDYQQAMNYELPNIHEQKTMTFNYYDNIDIFHITKLKVLQDHWQKICLQRLSIHQGDAFIYILRTLDNKAHQPEWSDCTDTNDPEKCVVYTWWKKRCPNRKRSTNGEIDACRSRFLYKHDFESNLYIPQTNDCAVGAHDCNKNAECIQNKPGPGYTCKCLDGFEGDGKDCDDIDECSLDSNNCSKNAKCKNTMGSFNCTCSNGFVGDGVKCEKVTSACSNEDLPNNAITVSNLMRQKHNGAIYRVTCKDGNITPTKPEEITELTAYKARCECENAQCGWSLSPEFTCEPGCPFKHLALVRNIRTWEDEAEKRKGLSQMKFKVQFKPPSGTIDGWRILIEFGIDVPESVIIRSRNSEVMVQDGRYLLLGNTSSNGKIEAEIGTKGFLFKLTRVPNSDKQKLLKNIKAHFVGSQVSDLKCFL